MTVLLFVVIIVIAYLLGSTNGAIIVSKIYHKGDIRNYGSGNAGSTNVLRSVGKSAAAITFLIDLLKGVVAIIIATLILTSFLEDSPEKIQLIYVGRYAAGIASITGHVFPLYYGFRGGKGIATSGAVIAALDWRILIFVLATFIISFAFKKIVSLSSILAASVFPVATFFVVYVNDLCYDTEGSLGFLSVENFIAVLAMSLYVALLVVIKHKDNIKRLLNGTEKPIIGKK